MLYYPATYEQIEVEKFNTAPRTVKYQEILNRAKSMFFSKVISDYLVISTPLGNDFYELPSKPYQVNSWDNLHLIAHNKYGDNDFWWLIGEYNKILDPFSVDKLSEIELPVKLNLMSWLIERVYG